MEKKKRKEKKSAGPDSFTGKFHQTFEEEKNQGYRKFVQKLSQKAGNRRELLRLIKGI